MCLFIYTIFSTRLFGVTKLAYVLSLIRLILLPDLLAEQKLIGETCVNSNKGCTQTDEEELLEARLNEIESITEGDLVCSNCNFYKSLLVNILWEVSKIQCRYFKIKMKKQIKKIVVFLQYLFAEFIYNYNNQIC